MACMYGGKDNDTRITVCEPSVGLFITHVAIWVFSMCLVYTPDGIILASWILYDLSELVVFELSKM